MTEPVKSSKEQAQAGPMPSLSLGEAQLAAYLFPHEQPVTSISVGKELVAPTSVVLTKLGMPYRVHSTNTETRFILNAGSKHSQKV
jgi:hypothetical protein